MTTEHRHGRGPTGLAPPAGSDGRRLFNRRNFFGSAALAGLAGTIPLGQSSLGAAGAVGRQADPEARSYGPGLDVRTFGARGDGKTDDTAAIQKALDRAGKNRGGIVHLPAGAYVVERSLQLPEDVVLQGIARGPVFHTGLWVRGPRHDLPGSGSTILATGGRGKEDGPPLITMATNSALAGISIYYPHQNWKTAPLPYPWTIDLAGANCTVENIELLNSWRGIRAVRAHRHLIRNITGGPLRVGIYLDEIFDLGHVENVHFNLQWRRSRPVWEFVYHHGESFVLGMAQWQYMFNTFSFGYHTGYRFIKTARGSCNGNFLGIGADGSLHAVLVEQAEPYGLQITNGEFVSFNWLRLPGELDPVQVVVAPSNRGPVRFVNCAFWGPSRNIARLDGDGTVGFSDCTLCQWGPGSAGVDARSGSLIVSGCEFQQPGRQVDLGARVRGAVISGNVAKGGWRITNRTGRRARIGLNSTS